MKKKSMKRLMATLVTGVVMTGMLGMTAFAGDVTKNLKKEAEVYVPNTTFEFTITPGTADGAIYAGPAGGVTMAGSTLTATPDDATLAATDVEIGKLALEFDITKFTAPGVYRYKIQETAGSYDGITYDEGEYLLDVYIVYDINGDLELAGSETIIAGEKQGFSDEGELCDVVITNLYGVDEDGNPDPLNPTSSLTITKTVTGNQGDKNKDFTFTITVTGETGEKYKIGADGTLTSGTSGTFTLKNGESIVITGLDDNDTYVVAEDDYSGEGYTTTVVGDETGTIDEDTTIAYTNDKEVSAPTGIIMNIAPYIMFVLLAVVVAVVFLSKKKNSEI